QVYCCARIKTRRRIEQAGKKVVQCAILRQDNQQQDDKNKQGQRRTISHRYLPKDSLPYVTPYSFTSDAEKSVANLVPGKNCTGVIHLVLILPKRMSNLPF